jgi:uncharacterized membrane protein/glutaredoxin
MAETVLLNVTLYTRKDCKLCDEARDHLKSLQKKFPHRLAEVDIDSDPVLQAKYSDQVPVMEVGPYSLKAPMSKQAIEMTLGAARDRRGQLVQVGDEKYREGVRKGQTVAGSDGIYFWLSKHYLALLNLVVFLYVGLPFLAPVLMKINADGPAHLIYTIYSPLCHQFGFRSFFLFGQQAYYPLKEAGLANVRTFDQITGFTDLANPFSISRLYARQFTGDPTVGYKVALCERDVAIYGSMVLFGLIYALTKRRLPALHWAIWILIGLGPIGLDGFSQLFSQFNWPWLVQYLPYRESTPFLRVLTGFLFGFTTAWFAYPNIEESMSETRQFFIKKFAVAKSV